MRLPKRPSGRHPFECPHVPASALCARPRTARQRGAAGLDPGRRQPAAGRRAIRRTGAVRPHRRRSLRCAVRQPAGIVVGLAPAGGLGGVRPVHDPVQRRGRAARRPAGASPAPGGDDELFRAHPAIAADLPHRHPFRPADEGDAERHRLVVAAVARIFPRAFRRDHVAGGAAAAGALHQLAAGHPAVRAVRGVHGADHAWWCARPTACRPRSRRITAICRRGPPTRSAMSRWCRASCASTPRCRACASSPTAAGGADAGAVVVGAGHGDYRASTTITVLAIFTVGIALHQQGRRSARS